MWQLSTRQYQLASNSKTLIQAYTKSILSNFSFNIQSRWKYIKLQYLIFWVSEYYWRLYSTNIYIKYDKVYAVSFYFWSLQFILILFVGALCRWILWWLRVTNQNKSCNFSSLNEYENLRKYIVLFEIINCEIYFKMKWCPLFCCKQLFFPLCI